MTHHTDAERAEFEAWYTQRYGLARRENSTWEHAEKMDALEVWMAARRAPAAPVPQIDPVHGDCLPPIGSRVFIRHGRDDDAHACIVTGYYAWGDLKGSKHLHRVFVRLAYEGTDTKQARMLCDCYATAEDAIAANNQTEAAPVELPAPDAVTSSCGDIAWRVADGTFVCDGRNPFEKLYTEQQVRELLAAHGIKEV